MTAAFSNLARLTSNASVPGQPSEQAAAEPRRRHLTAHERSFHLSWQTDATVLATNGAHRNGNDPVLDEAVLRGKNSAPYEDVVAVLDALRAPARAMLSGSCASVYAVSFAAD